MDKPFLTFDEQIEKLKDDYNLIINDYDFAIEALSSLSYYDLVNGYKSIYMKNDEYIEGTTIEQLYATHILNKNVQGVLIKYATYVENSFKTILSHVIACNISEHQDIYLDINNYQNKYNPNEKQKLRDVLNKMIETCKACEDTPTKHYRDNKNHIPPWILFHNVNFSNTSDLFRFLKRKEKEKFLTYIDILNTSTLSFDDKVKITIDSLKIVRKFRNIIAHNLNFLTYRKTTLNKKANILFVSSLVSKKEINISRNDIWGMVIAMVIFLNNKYIVQNFLAELNSFMQSVDGLSKIYCEITGIPLDFEERIRKYLDTINLDTQNIEQFNV